MTSRRHDPASPPGPHDEFWGEQAEWTQRPPSAERAGIGATVGRWWDAILGGGAVSERSHGRAGAPSSPSEGPDEHVDRAAYAGRTTVRGSASDSPTLGDEPGEGDGDGVWELEPEPQPTRHPGVDPLLARLGGLAVIVTLAAPLVLGFTSSGSDSRAAGSTLAAFSITPPSEPVDPTTTAVTEPPASAATTDPVTPPEPTGSTSTIAVTVAGTAPAADAGPAVEVPPTAVVASLEDLPEPAPTAPPTAPAVTTAPCGGRYEVAAGDYWIRLADAAGVSMADLLAVNDSSVDTVLVPGRSICLPVGAATPSPPPPPPPTAAPAPAPTASPATPAPSRPVTTVPPTPPTPTTAVPSRPAAVPQSQAAAVIRQVWPDDLEERALEIAWRESNHQSNVNNACCYGLFQIHWTAHRSWLATMGVTSAWQLFDPVVNATAAYTLYQRSGGFGPWGG